MRIDSTGPHQAFRAAGGRQRRELLHRGGRVVHPPRPVGLRQDDAAAADRRLLRAGRRRDPLRRPHGQRRAAARARHRHGVPELRALAAHDGVRERRLRAEAAQDPAGRDRGAGRAPSSRRSSSPGLGDRYPGPALRRAAAARGAGARAGAQSENPAARRAAVQPRRQDPHPGARRRSASCRRSSASPRST